jgi:hypothetical protein
MGDGGAVIGVMRKRLLRNEVMSVEIAHYEI